MRAKIREKHGEGSLADLAADFVIMAEHLSAERGRLEASGVSVGDLVDIAARCGQLRGRIFTDNELDLEKGVARKALTERGRNFFGKKTGRASRQRNRDAIANAAKLIEAANQEIEKGNGRNKKGNLNVSELMRICKKVVPNLGDDRIRHILGKANKNGKLGNRPTK